MTRHILTLTILLVAIRSAVAADQINLRDGKVVLGKIQQESTTEVVIAGTAGTQTIEVSRITEIRYDGHPATMTQARIFEGSGNWRGAADQYVEAQADLNDKPLVLQAAQFGEARSLARLALNESAETDKAIGRLDAFRKAHPQSRHHYPLHELLGRLYFAKNDYTQAAEAFDELAKAPWPDAQLRAALYQGRMLKAQKKLDEALARLDKIAAAQAESAELQLIQAEALLEKAGCFRAQNRRDQEIEALQQALARTPSNANPLQAEAYIALGDALQAAQKPKDALMAYLHVDLMFPQDKELHARALYNLTLLWTQLGHGDRAAKTRSTLKSEYPDSSWNKKLGS